MKATFGFGESVRWKSAGKLWLNVWSRAQEQHRSPSWVAFAKCSRGADVMMGDLALLQDEVNPVMSALLDNGIDVSAPHNPFWPLGL